MSLSRARTSRASAASGAIGILPVDRARFASSTGAISRGTTIARFQAFAIHVFTASGAALAFLALILAVGGQWAAMFLCLGLALVVDGIDGPLARKFDVAKVLPRWSGETLDLVVDFLTYVFVPAFAIAASGLLPQAATIACGVAVVITGALYFADRNMKTKDNYFCGFPAVWNLVAFYLYLLQPPAWIGAAGVAAFAILTFVPVKFVHPLRVKRLRPLNIGLLALWALLAATALAYNLSPPITTTAALAAIAVYFMGAGLAARPA